MDNEIIIKSGNKEKSINSYLVKICKKIEDNTNPIILKASGK
jgi:hypothetical protein